MPFQPRPLWRLLIVALCVPFVLASAHSQTALAPTVRWTFATSGPFYGSPVVAGDLVFVGGLDSVLHAVSLESGTERWHFRTGGGIRSAVAFDEKRLYLNGGDGTIYCLDRAAGSVVWKFATKGERQYDFADYFHSSPLLAGGTLYVGSGDGSVYALRASDGTVRWSFPTGGVVHTTPALAGGRLFVGSFDGYVYAIDAESGALAWKFKTVGHRYFPRGEVQGSPVVAGDVVIVGARDYNVYALDREKGFAHWNKAFGRGWGLRMTVQDSVLYIGSSDERIHVAADPATGTEYWRVAMEFLVFGGDAVGDTVLYLGTTNGKVHAHSRRGGERLWSFATPSYEKARFKYFQADDTYRSDIYSIIRSNEQFLDVEVELGGVFSTPVLSGGRLLFSSTNGTLTCLDLAR